MITLVSCVYMYTSGIASIFVCGKTEFGFVLCSFICIANLGLLLQGRSALAKMGQSLAHKIKYSLQNCINILLIKPVHSRSAAEISALHVIDFFFLHCFPL